MKALGSCYLQNSFNTSSLVIEKTPNTPPNQDILQQMNKKAPSQTIISFYLSHTTQMPRLTAHEIKENNFQAALTTGLERISHLPANFGATRL